MSLDISIWHLGTHKLITLTLLVENKCWKKHIGYRTPELEKTFSQFYGIFLAILMQLCFYHFAQV